MKCHVKVLNIAHIAHTTCGIGISNMPENVQKVNCSIGYEASGMGEDTGLCGIDPDDDTRGTGPFFGSQMLAREVRILYTSEIQYYCLWLKSCTS